jgi:hypothetical protein
MILVMNPEISGLHILLRAISKDSGDTYQDPATGKVLSNHDPDLDIDFVPVQQGDATTDGNAQNARIYLFPIR